MARNPTVEDQAKRIGKRIDSINNQVDFLNGAAPLGGRLGAGMRGNPNRTLKAEREKLKNFRKYLKELEIIYGVKLTQTNVDALVKEKTPKTKGSK